MTPREIVERFGPHPAHGLGLDVGRAPDRAGWLVAAILLGARVDEARAREAFLALHAKGLVEPSALAGVEPSDVADLLGAARFPRPERVAPVLVRASRALADHPAGSLDALAAECGDLSELGGALTRLAPGLGPATVLRFLRPLREHWPAAREVPLSDAARAAATDLGWIADGADAFGEPAALAAALRDAEDAPPPCDVEAALERLGARGCRSGRPERCPLGEDCPLR